MSKKWHCLKSAFNSKEFVDDPYLVFKMSQKLCAVAWINSVNHEIWILISLRILKISRYFSLSA